MSESASSQEVRAWKTSVDFRGVDGRLFGVDERCSHSHQGGAQAIRAGGAQIGFPGGRERADCSVK